MATDAAKAAAYEDTSRRLDDAHAYAHMHLSVAALGRNVWHAVLDDAIRLRAALSAAEARAWQAIETAPIIYSMTEEIPTCLVYSPQFGVRTGRAWRYPGGDACGDAYGFHGEWGVTHWMPLPAPPAALTEGERDG